MDNQFNYEENNTLNSSVNNNVELTPKKDRKILIPILVGVVILLIIAIEFAFSYFYREMITDAGEEFLENTRKKLVYSIDSYIEAATIYVDENAFGDLSDTNKLYYIRVDYDDRIVDYNRKKSCVTPEKWGLDPYGKWVEAYVVVHYNSSTYSYDYYFTYYDDADYGIPLTKQDDIKTSMNIDNNYNNINSTNITKQTNGLLTESGERIEIVVISPETNCLLPNG